MSVKFNFIGTISKAADNRLVWIPKKYHDKIEPMVGKQVKVMIDDEIFGSDESEDKDGDINMKQVKRFAKEVAERTPGTYRNLPRRKK